MRWWLTLLTLTITASGCRAPAPTFDPFAAYGPRCIPPPATGSIGTAPGYYQPPAAYPAPTGAPPAGSSSRVPLQPVPSLGSRPAERTGNATGPGPNGQWESATRTNNDFGYRPPTDWEVPPQTADRQFVGDLRRSDDLVWHSPPVRSSVIRAAAAELPLPTAPATADSLPRLPRTTSPITPQPSIAPRTAAAPLTPIPLNSRRSAGAACCQPAPRIAIPSSAQPVYVLPGGHTQFAPGLPQQVPTPAMADQRRAADWQPRLQ